MHEIVASYRSVAVVGTCEEEKDAMPEMEMRHRKAKAIMQGMGYGKPHAGMADGHAGPNPHEPEFMKAHGVSDRFQDTDALLNTNPVLLACAKFLLCQLGFLTASVLIF
jgi:hypothetical protein